MTLIIQFWYPNCHVLVQIRFSVLYQHVSVLVHKLTIIIVTRIVHAEEVHTFSAIGST